MKIIRLLLLTLMLSGSTRAEVDDIRSLVNSKKIAGADVINLKTSVFLGVPLGASEGEVFEALGKPEVYARITEDRSAAIYENRRAFIFIKGKMAGIRITHGMMDFELMKVLGDRATFTHPEWKFSNGVEDNMSLKRVKEILGDQLESEDGNYRHYFTEGETRVELQFSMRHGMEGDLAYKLMGMLIAPKS